MAVAYNRAFLKSEYFYLRPLTTEDISEEYLSWLNDSETNKNTSRYRFPYSMQDIGDHIKDSINKKRMVFAICNYEDKHIGNISLQEIDWINRSAELAILIGDKRFQCKGYGHKACQLLIKHAFERLNLHRVYLGTPQENEAMIRTANKLNMEWEGTFKDAFYGNTGYQHVFRYAIINKIGVNNE